MNMTVTDPSVPVGQHRCRFLGVETCETKYGPKLRWVFVVIEGEHEGKKTSALSTETPTVRNNAGKYLCSLLGQAPTVGVCADPNSCIGTIYTVDVRETESGGTIVDSFEKDELPF